MKETNLKVCVFENLCVFENSRCNKRLQTGMMCKDHERVHDIYKMRSGVPFKCV